jgi:hypothetical protein
MKGIGEKRLPFAKIARVGHPEASSSSLRMCHPRERDERQSQDF